MNVLAMAGEIFPVTNSMVRESTLPDFSPSANHRSESVRKPAFDELNRALNRHVRRRSKEKMNMLGHDDKSVQFKLAFAPIAVKGLQKEPRVRFDYKEPSPLPC